VTVPVGLQVVWFKRDLRIHDHAPLALAAQRGPVLPLFVAEPDLWQQSDMSGRQWAFAAESLADLQVALAQLGQPLTVYQGDVIETLCALHRRYGIAGFWSHEETGNAWTYARDVRVAAWAKAAGIPWHEARQTGVIRRLKSRYGWAKAWDQDMARPIIAAPARLPTLGFELPIHIPTADEMGLAADPCPHRKLGGRIAGEALLNSFLFSRGRDYRYQMSSPVTAFEASSRLSPHIAWGTLSLREIAQATWTRMAALKSDPNPDAKTWRGSMVSFSGRQHWHCHFMQKLEDEPEIEFRNLHRAYDGLRPNTPDPLRFDAWASGKTGFPFVDACMRALDQHGWINFRMRAMLMSFASYHLWLPWRDTGLHLARQFVDYEPGIHWPQVQMQSGTTGINTMRIYNPVKQGYDQDPGGAFVRRYVPELAAVPDAFIHEPWRWEKRAAIDYPPPIVDNVDAARAARTALSTVRKGADHRSAAKSIAAKHGSRRSGMPMTGQSRRAKKMAAPPPAQFTLEF
jgi:deoxyribodipyrimidine photo-lyase